MNSPEGFLSHLRNLMDRDEIRAKDLENLIKGPSSWISEFIPYNYKDLDEDFLGKAYETYLAAKRKEQGIYYTPQYIVQYIVKNSVGEYFEIILKKLELAARIQNIEEIEFYLKQFFSVKILDLACGSGAFLIEALRVIWVKYQRLYNILEQYLDKSNDVRKLLNIRNKWDLVSKIIIRHIYGTDSDSNGLDIAKLNLWLAAIKLMTDEIKFTENITQILPNLAMNLTHGNSLIGLPKELALNHLKGNYKNELERLFKLRYEYLLNTTNTNFIRKIVEIKNILKNELNIEFENYLEENRFPAGITKEAKPLFWELEFWFSFFEEKLNIKPQNLQGFDVIIGNPPYISWNDIGGSRKYFEKSQYESLQYKCRPNHPDSQPNIYLFFMIKSLNLLKDKGIISLILPQEWLFHTYAQDFRNYIINNSGDIYVFKFDSKYRVFNEDEVVGTNSLLFFLRKNSSSMYYEFLLSELEDHIVQQVLDKFDIYNLFNQEIGNYNISKNRIHKANLLNIRWESYSEFFETLLHKFESPEYVKLDNKEYFSVMGGFQPPIEVSKDFMITSEQINRLDANERKYIFRCIYEASRIKRYYLNKKDIFWIILNRKFETSQELEKECPHIFEILSKSLGDKGEKWWEFPNVRNLEAFTNFEEKLLASRTSKRNSFALDTKKHIIKGTNTALVSLKLNIFYCLGILNSVLADYWYREYGYSYHGSVTKKYEPKKVKKYMIPIPKNGGVFKTNIINHVRKLIGLISNGNNSKNKANLDKEIQKTDNIIDANVLKLYKLNRGEVCTIINSLSLTKRRKNQIIDIYDSL